MQDWIATTRHRVTRKRRKRWSAYKKAASKEPKYHGFLLTLDMTPFRS